MAKSLAAKMGWGIECAAVEQRAKTATVSADPTHPKGFVRGSDMTADKVGNSNEQFALSRNAPPSFRAFAHCVSVLLLLLLLLLLLHCRKCLFLASSSLQSYPFRTTLAKNKDRNRSYGAEPRMCKDDFSWLELLHTITHRVGKAAAECILRFRNGLCMPCPADNSSLAAARCCQQPDSLASIPSLGPRGANSLAAVISIERALPFFLLPLSPPRPTLAGCCPFIPQKPHG